ncbi:MAG: Putative queuosine biosynthesis protein [Leptospirillum sp. Group II 'C75']|jgi:S-adenosylmethionine:tRNA ribosyltransferase-isomerase|uniref:S-adenosylmethionine:tRNA ribosyltransferase-isomerase n=1 Tax=Leptospirillum ferriphilum (strain ML-04) TaxID=1048260 RepID=J9Z757_LEPFM|nr:MULTISPECIES: tRNA preQ1(34) S-adenosylmethionine ribosyltransferase-isomerase QueA [Leptospirillum]AFS52305.1 S-adenosylmethionine:tRNA ribosyltransferase-isomerase [Leptospirillum ferriphilum ML-04]EAY57984.1 MAG: putative queuosine biosynthesis protein [Leptospirillum rubarum]EIJ77329.1 MAG: Putative queuosine biosynthesis protein [Leptospirillum sp. Group II 'C75']
MTSDENMHHTRLDPGTFYQPETLWTTNEEQLSVSRGNPDEYDYDLPEDRIRLFPPKNRGESRLLVVGRDSGGPYFGTMEEFSRFLFPGDLLVLNDSRVLPARVFIRAPTGRKIELLFLNPQDPSPVRFLGKGIGSSSTLSLPGGGRVRDIRYLPEEGCFQGVYEGEETLLSWLESHGEMPLPPYIRKARDHHPSDRERYQTVFSRHAGSVAAPTAGLHFTEALLEHLKDKGVETATVTLHVGIGTFRPLGPGGVGQHVMHAERFLVPDETVQKIEDARRRGSRVFAVGTTVMRTLETWGQHPVRDAVPAWTRLFIRPGFPFRVVDGLLTNFHQPRSTLVVLVDSFLGGNGRWRSLYRQALEEGFMFLSYGDAMLIVPEDRRGGDA